MITNFGLGDSVQQKAATQEDSMTTFELSRAIGIQAESLRKAVARNGHYFGLTPARLPNGRLSWPDDSVAQLKERGAKC